MSESVSSDPVGHSADLRTRIAAAIERSLVEQFPPNLPDRYGDWIKNDALADAVIRELEADYILVPKSHTVARWIPQGIFDERT